MLLEAVQVKLKVSNLRAELQLTQVELAEMAGVARLVVVNAEATRRDVRISRLSAFAILDALNRARVQKGLSVLAFDDIEWKIQGEN